MTNRKNKTKSKTAKSQKVELNLDDIDPFVDFKEWSAPQMRRHIKTYEIEGQVEQRPISLPLTRENTYTF